MLHVLAVDDERPALDELAYLLRQDPRIGQVTGAGDASSALRDLSRMLVAGSASTPCSSTSGCRGSTGSTSPGCSPGSPRPARGVRDRARRLRRHRLRTGRARLPAETGPAGAARRVGPPGGRGRAPHRPADRGVRRRPRRRADPRRARRPDPARLPPDRDARGGAGRLRPAAHRRRRIPRPDAAVGADQAVGGGGVHPDPPQHPGRVRAHHRGALRRRPRGRPDRRRTAAGQPPPHPRGTRPPGAAVPPAGRRRRRGRGPGPGAAGEDPS